MVKLYEYFFGCWHDWTPLHTIESKSCSGEYGRGRECRKCPRKEAEYYAHMTWDE